MREGRPGLTVMQLVWCVWREQEVLVCKLRAVCVSDGARGVRV